MSYTVEILRSAQKQLARLERQAQERVVPAIRALSKDPRPVGCRKLTGRPAWRIRIGDYRVIYEIEEGRLLILVVSVGHRKEVYR